MKVLLLLDDDLWDPYTKLGMCASSRFCILARSLRNGTEVYFVHQDIECGTAGLPGQQGNNELTGNYKEML